MLAFHSCSGRSHAIGKDLRSLTNSNTLQHNYYLENCPWANTRPSRRIGNLTSQLPTMFWILNSVNFACNRHTIRVRLSTTWPCGPERLCEATLILTQTFSPKNCGFCIIKKTVLYFPELMNVLENQASVQP